MGPDNAPDTTTAPAREALAFALADAASRPMRADAQRNRMRVLEAAREVFAEEGTDAGMEAIAQRASVGVGTVYRHFATKDALIEALVELHFAEKRDALDRLVDHPDPWAAITGYLEYIALAARRDRIFGEMNDPREIPYLAPIIDEMHERWAKLIARAQEQGTLRRDFEAQDIPNVMCGLCTVVMSARTDADWRRYLDLIVAGLRADATTVDAGERSALTAR